MPLDEQDTQNLGTGEQVRDIIAEYDRPDEEILRERGVVMNGDLVHVISLLGIRAMKEALQERGFKLQNPTGPITAGWHRYDTETGGTEPSIDPGWNRGQPTSDKPETRRATSRRGGYQPA